MSSGTNRPSWAMTPILSYGATYKHHLLSISGIGSLPWAMPNLAQPREAAGLMKGRVRDYPSPRRGGDGRVPSHVAQRTPQNWHQGHHNPSTSLALSC